MANPLARLKTSNDVEDTKDSLGGGGGGALDSAVYPILVKAAFFGYSKGGAMSLTIEGSSGNKNIKNTMWITSGDAKGNKNYYEKDGVKHYLPGFNMANAIVYLATGKEISDTEIEEKTWNIYDFEEQKEVPTAVDMLVELVGETIAVGLLKRIEDKTTLVEGKGYLPNGDVREINEITAVFRADDGLTMVEAKASDNSDEEVEPIFLQKWKDKWEGEVDDRAKREDKTGGAGKASGGSKKAAGEKKKPSKSLF